MQVKKLAFILYVFMMLSACTNKVYTKQESALIVFKTSTFKYADLGFIYENDEETKVDIYSSGQAVMSLKLSSASVCMSFLECMSKKQFNKQILNAMYPEDFLENVFKGQPIFHGENMLKTSNGFTQKLRKTDEYNINYSVLNKQILFHDTINNILIKIKRLH